MAKIKIEVSEIKGECSNGMKVGDHYILDGYTINIPDGKKICIWALNNSLLTFPILAVRKDIKTDHWIKELKTLSCPDNKVIFSITDLE